MKINKLKINMQNKKLKNFYIVFFILVFVLQTGASFVIFAPQAKAQAVVTDPGRMTQEQVLEAERRAEEIAFQTRTKVLDKIFDSLVLSASISLKNILITATQSLSEQTTDYVMTGDWGQGPMWYDTTWEYFQNQLLDYTLSSFLQNIQLAGPWNKSFNICDPSLDVKLQIVNSLSLGGHDIIDRPLPECNWKKVKDNWIEFAQDLQDKFENPSVASFVMVDLWSDSLRKEQNDVGNFMMVTDLADAYMAEQEKAVTREREELDGYRDRTDILRTTRQNPPGTTQQIEEARREQVLEMPSAEMQMAGDVVSSIPQAMVSAFVSSFVSKTFVSFLYNNITGGYVNKARDYVSGSQLVDYAGQAKKKNYQLNKVNFSVSVKEVDLLTEFTACPTGVNANINNCVIDNDFARAIRSADTAEPLTVGEAIQQDKLNAQKPLISDDRDNTKSCFEEGYCYSNLVKLRKARILPIGWELASLQANTEEDTLEYAIKHYDTCPTDLSDMNTCPAGEDCRFCHLIDKDWVLKAPKTQCDAVGYGPLLVGDGAQDRYEYCADLTSCIKYDANGQCQAYSYCAAEKNTWRLGGTECDGQYSSCLNLRDDDGKNFSYLLNTVDYADCNADNVGCAKYSTWQESQTGAVSDWALEYPADAPYYEAEDSLIYLDKDKNEIECSANEEGCTKFIRTSQEFGANLVQNSGFEEGAGVSNLGWTYDTSPNFVSDGYSGRAVQKDSGMFEQIIKITPKNFNTYYNISAKVRADDLAINVDFITMGDILARNAEFDLEVASENIPDLSTVWLEWSRVVVVPPETDYLRVGFDNESGLQIDEFLVTQIDGPTTSGLITYAYTEYNSDIGQYYMQKAPDYNFCYDYGTSGWYDPESIDLLNFDNDSPQCNNFAQICSAEEVGCTAYTAKATNQLITAVSSYEDRCPAECVGYETYFQPETDFANEQFPINMIPSTGQSCSADQVGCEEFTNLDTLAAGGEGIEYYSQLRQCIKPSEGDCANFYTWAGSDVSGYQLQVYTLEANGDEPNTTVDDSFICNESTYDPQNFPECRQFYNENGEISYHIFTNTITCSEDCHPYRRTITGSNEEQECDAHGGEYINDECIYYAIPSESTSCSATNAGCREYRGNQAGDVNILLDDTFEPDNGGITGWTGGTLSSESMIAGGHSLYVTGDASTDVSGQANSQYSISFWASSDFDSEVAFNLLNSGEQVGQVFVNVQDSDGEFKYYTSEILAPTADFDQLQISAQIQYTAFDTKLFPVYFDNLELKTLNDTKYLLYYSWSTPASCDQTIAGQDLDQAQLGCQEYTDQNNETHYLKSFRNLCRMEAVGCEALIDTKNSASAFEQEFDNGYKVPGDDLIYLVLNDEYRCNANSAGCTLIGEPELDAEDNVKVDSETGNEIWNQNFYKLSADNLDNYLCEQAEAGCTHYTNDKGTDYYFKDPGERVCEWKRVDDSGGERYGWFKLGTNEDCDPMPKDYYDDGVLHMVTNRDSGYDGWVGLCPDSENKCTAFIDPVDVSGTSQFGKPYYFIKDDNIQNCSKVSQEEGCLLFNDTSLLDSNGDPELKYSAIQTYEESEDQNGAAVLPMSGTSFADSGKFIDWLLNSQVDCEQIPSENYCDYIQDCVAGEENDFECILPFLPNWEDLYQDKVRDDLEAAYGYLSDCDVNGNNIYDEMACYMFTQSGDYNDSNTMLKVVRDRECAAWYDCESGYWTYDSAQGRYVFSCQKLGLCDEYSATSASNKCAHFITEEEADNLLSQNEPLNFENYRQRDVSWNSIEYTGYAISNMYPLQFYGAYDINSLKDQDEDVRLLHINKTSDSCIETDSQLPISTKLCGETIAYMANNSVTLPKLEVSNDNECRAYPQSDSPFPYSTQETEAKSQFSNVNLCEVERDDDGTATSETDLDGGCNYTVKTYGQGQITKYIPEELSISASGYCQDDHNKSCSCSNQSSGSDDPLATLTTKAQCSSTDCASSDTDYGTCLRADDETTQYRGWQGYCLEYDKSLQKNGMPDDNPCLTWYPLDSMAGLQDLYNQYDEAGFDAEGQYPDGGPYYCVESNRWESRGPYATEYTGYIDCHDDEDNPIIIVHSSNFEDNKTPFTGKEMENMSGPNTTGKDLIKNLIKEGYIVLENGGWQGGGYRKIVTINEPNMNTLEDIVEDSLGDSYEIEEKDNIDADTFVQILKDSCEGITTGGVSKLKNLKCADNYEPKTVYKVHREGDYLTWDGDADKYTVSYECVPINYEADSGNQKKWYQDLLGTVITVADPDGFSEPYSEEEKDNCEEMYLVADTDNKLGDNKAYTNRIYQNYDFGGAMCPANSSLDIDSSLPCSNFGALSLSGTDLEENLENAFLGDSCSKELPKPEGGTHCFNSSNNIYELFSSLYGHWTQKIQGIKNICLSVYDNANTGLECSSDNDCQGNVYLHEPCQKFVLKKCDSNSPDAEMEGESCFTDKDCGAFSTFSYNAQGEWDLQFCTEEYAPNESFPDCKDLGGEYFAEQYFDSGEIKYKSICLKYMYPYNGVSCEKGSFLEGWNPDISAKCYSSVISYPSDSEKVLYEEDSSTALDDNSFDYVNHPPIVAGTVASGLYDTKGDEIWTAKPGTITVNNVNEEDGIVWGYNGQKVAFMNFYAWADDDQMPLTRITVDWDDGVPVPPPDGKYKNHKPRCQRAEDKDVDHGGNIFLGLCDNIPGYTCGDDTDCYVGAQCIEQINNGDRFGDTSDACTESYFTFSNVYTCEGPGSVDDGDCAGPDDSNCWDTDYQACRWIPKVQVLDNWGWCNAESDSNCETPFNFDSAFGDLVGCYNEEKVGGEIGDQCEMSKNDAINWKPWTEFDGMILVKP